MKLTFSCVFNKSVEMVKVLRIPAKGGMLSSLRKESYANENIREQLNTKKGSLLTLKA